MKSSMFFLPYEVLNESEEVLISSVLPVMAPTIEVAVKRFRVLSYQLSRSIDIMYHIDFDFDNILDSNLNKLSYEISSTCR